MMLLLNLRKMKLMMFTVIIIIEFFVEKNQVFACDDTCQNQLLDKFKMTLYSDFKFMLLADIKYTLNEFKREMVNERNIPRQEIQGGPSSEHQLQNLLPDIDTLLKNKLDPIVIKIGEINNKLADLSEIELVDIKTNSEAAAGRSDANLGVTNKLYTEVKSIASAIESWDTRLKLVENVATNIAGSVNSLEQNTIKNISSIFYILGDKCNSSDDATANILRTVSSLEKNVQNLAEEAVSFSESMNNATGVINRLGEKITSLENKSNNIFGTVTSLEKYVTNNVTDVADSLVGSVTSLKEYVSSNWTDLVSVVDSLANAVTSLEKNLIQDSTNELEINVIKGNINSLQENYQIISKTIATIEEWKNCSLSGDCFVIGHQRFKMILDRMSWTNARDHCVNIGLELAQPTDPLSVRQYIQDKGWTSSRTWIGAVGSGSCYQWLNGTCIPDNSPLWGWGPEGDKTSAWAINIHERTSSQYQENPLDANGITAKFHVLCEKK